MDKSILVKIFGFPATLIHGETSVLERWLWLKKRLPKTNNGEKLIDIGCGSGAFTIGAALRGYEGLGLSWDERNQNIAQERATLCQAKLASFQILDVRKLDSSGDLIEQFDVAISCENIEHIIDDFKLMRDMASCLKPGGRLLLTTPNYYYKEITEGDKGPFCTIETGWHVRRGYTPIMLKELCEYAGLQVNEISYCTGFLSQKISFLLRYLSEKNLILAWLITLPLRILPLIFDRFLTNFMEYPYFSICLDAYKPRKSLKPNNC